MFKEFKKSELLEAYNRLEEREGYVDEHKLPTDKFDKMKNLIDAAKIIVEQNKAENMSVQYISKNGCVTVQAYVVGADKNEIESWKNLLSIVDCFEMDVLNNGMIELNFTILDIFKV